MTKKSFPVGAPLAASPLLRVVVDKSQLPAGLTDVTVPMVKFPVEAINVICELPSVNRGLVTEAKAVVGVKYTWYLLSEERYLSDRVTCPNALPPINIKSNINNLLKLSMYLNFSI
jgi:hypothetical protein